MADERDDPLTPAGRLFLRPEMNQIINSAIGMKHPIDVNAFRAEITNSIWLHHPRFYSLLVRDRRGREHWRRTNINVDRHITVREERVDGDAGLSDEDAVNEYLADLAVSSPLGTDKPLWEVHLLMAHRCAVFRVHHALGDGISLMSMLLCCCRRAADPSQMPTVGGLGASKPAPARGGGGRRRLWGLLVTVWLTVVFTVELMMRILGVKDERTVIGGGEGVELWPRKLATARFSFHDMKTVKMAVANATINDVLFGIICSGLSKYLEIRSSKPIREGLQITGVAMVNLRPQPGLQELAKLIKSKSGTRWGNKFGIVLLPVKYHKGGCDPLQYVKNAKNMVDRKKQSLEAAFSYKTGYVAMSCLGAKAAGWLNYRIVCNTTFTISNVVGPHEEITLVGNPVTYIRAITSSLPQAITLHMLSYAGRADMQILVAKDIVPDPEVMAKCFEDSLLEMKEAAMAAATK